jgi:hypothetical protein
MFKSRYLVVGIFPDGSTINAGPFSHRIVADKAAQLLSKWYPRLKIAQVVEDTPRTEG